MTAKRFFHTFGLNESQEERFQEARTKVKQERDVLDIGIDFLITFDGMTPHQLVQELKK